MKCVFEKAADLGDSWDLTDHTELSHDPCSKRSPFEQQEMV